MRVVKTVGLASRDYAHEWQMSGCFVLALAAVLGPMLVLFGLKFGIVGGMVEQLVEDPENREVRPVGSGRFDPAWFGDIARRKDVAFVVPRTRSIAATVELNSEQSPRIVRAELIPSGPGEPLLPADGRLPTGLDQVVLSQSAATRLQVAAGDRVAELEVEAAPLAHDAGGGHPGAGHVADVLDAAEGLPDERLRELPGIFDVTQAPVIGKKGRLTVRIQVLGDVSRIDAILDKCLTETTTLGVRWHTVTRATLARDENSHELHGTQVRVKRALRPDGIRTRKVEMADLAGTPGGHAGRQQRRREAYTLDLEDDDDNTSGPGSGK